MGELITLVTVALGLGNQDARLNNQEQYITNEPRVITTSELAIATEDPSSTSRVLERETGNLSEKASQGGKT
jgi:hypothetical protein